MRQKWYVGFGIVLLTIFYFFLMLNDARWFFGLLIPLVFIGVYDFLQPKHSILRNFPILGHIRYFLEFLRPELRQYLIADDIEEKPFSRDQRNIVYERAKNELDTMPFGSDIDMEAIGYTWIAHSITPKPPIDVEPRIIIGGPQCRQPYSASRLNISAMSFGALSPNALMALNLGAQMGNFAHNTGEGGISQYHLQGGDLVFQLGTGYFGCRDLDGHFDPEEFKKEALRPEVKMIEVKLSQGAKPAHGGILPAAKVTEEIARVRKVSMGKDILSPIAHSAFQTPTELLYFIQKLRELSNGKPIGFKLCIGQHEQFLGICKAMHQTQILPDFINIDGAEGGTGAAPFEYSNYLGQPLEEALVFVHNSLIGINVRDKIRIFCAGKIITGFDMVLHLSLGADVCNSARGMMMSLGCVQSRQCNMNTCPTGVATQNIWLQRGLVVEDKKVRVYNFHTNTLKSFSEIVGAMGLTNPSEINPNQLIRRITETKSKRLSEIYHFIEPGSLLNGEPPASFKMSWEKADPDKF